jgi:hypothetical protein
MLMREAPFMFHCGDLKEYFLGVTPAQIVEPYNRRDVDGLSNPGYLSASDA